MHGRGMHGGGMHGRTMHDRGHAWPWGHAWWGGASMAGKMATAADGMHSTGMLSCLLGGIKCSLIMALFEKLYIRLYKVVSLRIWAQKCSTAKF